MRSSVTILAVGAVLAFATAPAGAQQGPVETVMEGCKTELETYCKDVTPGEQRILACFYAHGDKLSPQCSNALYDAAVQLETAIAALKIVAVGCEAEIDSICADVPAGEGRILHCLQANAAKVGESCDKAMTTVGLK
jgi:hypothetical protein